MDILSKFLERFRSFGLREQRLKEKTTRVIQEIASIQIPISQIKYKNGTIYLDVEAIIKSEIYLHKSSILESLKARERRDFIIEDLR